MSIEQYINSLPDKIEIISVSNKNITYLPNLNN